AWHRYPLLTLLWVGHLITLLPFGGYFERPYLLGDRYNYQEAVVLAVAMGAILAWGQARVTMLIRTAGTAGLVVLSAGLAIRASSQAMIWTDGETTLVFTIKELDGSSFRKEFYWQLGKIYVFAGSEASTKANGAAEAAQKYAQAIDAADLTLRE